MSPNWPACKRLQEAASAILQGIFPLHPLGEMSSREKQNAPHAGLVPSTFGAYFHLGYSILHHRVSSLRHHIRLFAWLRMPYCGPLPGSRTECQMARSLAQRMTHRHRTSTFDASVVGGMTYNFIAAKNLDLIILYA